MNNFFKYFRLKTAFLTLKNVEIHKDNHNHTILTIGLTSHYPIFEHMDYYNRNIAKMAQCLNKLMDTKHKYAIVCTGTSGISLAVGVHSLLNVKPDICYIRKENEDNHGHGNKIFGTYDKLIVIDDLVCSGDTMRYISNRLQRTQHHLQVEAICACTASIISHRTEWFPNLKYIIQ